MKTFIALALSLTLIALTGCATDQKSASAQSGSSVTDLSTPNAQSNYIPPMERVQPVSAEPIAISAPTASAPEKPVKAGKSAKGVAATASADAGGYKVRKGDTLFSIAKARYGDGKQWQKIASANPGLSPTTLKAGSTISIPQ